MHVLDHCELFIALVSRICQTTVIYLQRIVKIDLGFATSRDLLLCNMVGGFTLLFFSGLIFRKPHSSFRKMLRSMTIVCPSKI